MSNLATLAPLLLLLAAVWFLRPAFLGGDFTYVIVHGRSMEPTMYSGDLALARKASGYAVGDVAAFVAIDSRSGMTGVVIHRIIGGTAEEGFILQGDNNDYVDPWRPTADQMVGKAVFFMPRLGHVFSYLQEPARLAAAGGVLFAYLSLVGYLLSLEPRSRARRRQRAARRRGGLAAWLN